MLLHAQLEAEQHSFMSGWDLKYMDDLLKKQLRELKEFGWDKGHKI